MAYLRADAKRVARESFRGLWAAITMPFGPSGDIDGEAIGADIERLTGPLRHRVHPVPYIKAWAGLLGLSGGAVRAPLDHVTDGELRALAADLRSVGLLADQGT